MGKLEGLGTEGARIWQAWEGRAKTSMKEKFGGDKSKLPGLISARSGEERFGIGLHESTTMPQEESVTKRIKSGLRKRKEGGGRSVRNKKRLGGNCSIAKRKKNQTWARGGA